MANEAANKLLLATQQEKPNHYTYLKEFRVEQCQSFLQHKCNQHRPFICFNWHFQNQRRRRPIRKRDGTFNYSADNYCTKYDETTGICPDGDECPFLHRTAGDTERRYHLRYYKTCMCVHDTDSRGYCVKNGHHCAFAHGIQDQRPPVYDIKEIEALATPDIVLEGGNTQNALDKERNLMNEDPKWQDTNYVLANYKTEPCKRPPRLCRQGYACPQYHNSKDKRRSPRKFKYRSTPCPNVKHGEEWGEPGNCESGDNCQYCHTRTEQQFHPEIYKSTKCNDVQQAGYCPRSVFCAFAHVEPFLMTEEKQRELDSIATNLLSDLITSALPEFKSQDANALAIGENVLLQRQILYFLQNKNLASLAQAMAAISSETIQPFSLQFSNSAAWPPLKSKYSCYENAKETPTLMAPTTQTDDDEKEDDNNTNNGNSNNNNNNNSENTIQYSNVVAGNNSTHNYLNGVNQNDGGDFIDKPPVSSYLQLYTSSSSFKAFGAENGGGDASTITKIDNFQCLNSSFNYFFNERNTITTTTTTTSENVIVTEEEQGDINNENNKKNKMEKKEKTSKKLRSNKIKNIQDVNQENIKKKCKKTKKMEKNDNLLLINVDGNESKNFLVNTMDNSTNASFSNYNMPMERVSCSMDDPRDNSLSASLVNSTLMTRSSAPINIPNSTLSNSINDFNSGGFSVNIPGSSLNYSPPNHTNLFSVSDAFNYNNTNSNKLSNSLTGVTQNDSNNIFFPSRIISPGFADNLSISPSVRISELNSIRDDLNSSSVGNSLFDNSLTTNKNAFSLQSLQNQTNSDMNRLTNELMTKNSQIIKLSNRVEDVSRQLNVMEMQRDKAKQDALDWKERYDIAQTQMNLSVELRNLSIQKLKMLQSKLRTDLEDVEKVLYLENAKKCMKCEKNNRAVTLEPCNHFILCSECACSVTECPYCQVQIVTTHT